MNTLLSHFFFKPIEVIITNSAEIFLPKCTLRMNATDSIFAFLPHFASGFANRTMHSADGRQRGSVDKRDALEARTRHPAVINK